MTAAMFTPEWEKQRQQTMPAVVTVVTQIHPANTAPRNTVCSWDVSQRLVRVMDFYAADRVRAAIEKKGKA